MASASSAPLRLQSLKLASFRNHREFSLDDLGELTILLGENGVGKTNVLEAIALTTAAQTFRHSPVASLIREGDDSARIVAELSDGNRALTTELLLEPGRKRYAVNGKAKAVSDVRGTLPAVIFTPDDLELTKKSSHVRRDALDDFGVQLTASYSIVRRDYEKVIRYKNRLLKDEAPPLMVDSINETLVTCASQLYCYRVALVERLMPLIVQNHGRIAGEESAVLSGSYTPSWQRVVEGPALDPDAPALSRDEVREHLEEALATHGPQERARKRSLIGPHNDQVDFFLDDRPVAEFGSQGQQRSIVLAWKLAEVELARQSLGINPVLLLDDVMSELDQSRRDMLVGFVTADIQTFITATDLISFNDDLLGRARIVEL